MRILFLVLCFLMSITLIAQKDSTQIKLEPTASKKSGIGTIFQGSPGKAALYSLMLPGAGQVYNKRIWKLPFVYALEGTTVYFVIRNTNQHQRYSRCYESILNENTSNEDCGRITTSKDAFTTRNKAKTQREYAWLALVAGHLLQSLEAYIDRHLIDFDIDDDLSYGFDNQQILTPEIKIISLCIPLSHAKKKAIPINF